MTEAGARESGAADVFEAALTAFLRELSREPDLDAPELLPFDATDRLLLQAARDPRFGEALPGGIAVIGDRHGALALGAVRLLGATGVRVHQDPLLGERALHANADRLDVADAPVSLPLGPELLRGAKLVLLQLPRGLDALDEIAQAIARWADPAVVVLAGGRVKHMTLAMNEVLQRSFADVSAGLARQKSRVLTATAARPEAALGAPRFPVWGGDPDLGFRLAAYGAAFGGTKLDRGTRLLLDTMRTAPPRGSGPGRTPARIVDLGCGTGTLAVSAARAWPDAEVIATDQSSAAVASTRLTAEAAGVAGRVATVRADGCEAVPDGWADLILLNPPFHSGSTVHTAVAHRLIRSCARALAPGGELRIVFNSPLGYRPILERAIGPAEQLARDRTFTVLTARKARAGR